MAYITLIYDVKYILYLYCMCPGVDFVSGGSSWTSGQRTTIVAAKHINGLGQTPDRPAFPSWNNYHNNIQEIVKNGLGNLVSIEAVKRNGR